MEIGKTYILNKDLEKAFISMDPSYNQELADLLYKHGPKFVVNNTYFYDNVRYVNNVIFEDGTLGSDVFHDREGNKCVYFELAESEFPFFKEVGEDEDPVIIQVAVSRSNAQETLDLIKATFNLA
ncbi:hypothetical protein A54_270 [Septuagintavirus sv54]|uniref:Uncharacterized protein n=1 Tax=Escherichia phage A5-4 TaxID=2996162 RepID=A0AAE9PTH3_9CAUD|nr:hypothetical protein A54_270 [Escherichia phage A5-4]